MARTLQPRDLGGVLRIPLSDLRPEEDAWFIQTSVGPLVLMRTPVGLSAVSGVCTHMSCRVRPSGTFLRCPCHGSTFDPDGTVVRGPATLPLPSYVVHQTVDAVQIVVSQ